MASHSGVVSENRSLTSEERELITWLISNGTPEARNYIPQLEELRVVSRCAWGILSIPISNFRGFRSPFLLIPISSFVEVDQ